MPSFSLLSAKDSTNFRQPADRTVIKERGNDKVSGSKASDILFHRRSFEFYTSNVQQTFAMSAACRFCIITMKVCCNLHILLSSGRTQVNLPIDSRYT